MKSFIPLRKVGPHILFITLILVSLLVTPYIYDTYYVKQGKPISVDIKIPERTEAVQFGIDGMETYTSQGVFNLTGWAFPIVDQTIPAGNYQRLVVLQSASGNYVFQADTTKRIDIQTVFKELGMDVIMSGLSALIFKDSLPIGTYALGLIFKNISDGSSLYMDLNQCITRTPNHLWLEGMESSACREVTHNDGSSIRQNIHLPVEITNVNYSLENLELLDDRGIYQLSGWAFPVLNKKASSGEYERQIVLISDTGNLLFRTITQTRVDIDIYFSNIDMDLTRSGVSALISQEALEYKMYGLGIIFTRHSTGDSYFFLTSKCIIRDSNGLALVDNKSLGCGFQSP